MKVAVLADIHGNRPALEVVAKDIDDWQPDKVILAGDVVNRGPSPLECLEFVLEKERSSDWLFVRGNHEDYVIDQARRDAPRSGPAFDIAQAAYWTLGRLNGDVSALKAMPFQVSFDVDGDETRIVHASMRGNRVGIYPETPDDDLRQQIAPPPAVLCVGHTHRPLIRRIDQSLVINVGSAGMSFDDDPRAAYARLRRKEGQWSAEIVRLDYDQAQTDRDFFESGFFDQAGDLVRIMLLEFRQSRPLIHTWSRIYEEAVRAGQIAVAESVDRYLDSINGSS
jgi:putative phosphoesterase